MVGSTILTHEQRYDIPAVLTARPIDPTGVGDAYRAGLIRGLALGLPWDTIGRVAALAATYVLENHGPQNHQYTREEFTQRYRTQFGNGGLHFVLTRTNFGRYVYAIGGNEEATRLSGIRVGYYKAQVYVLSGVTSAVAAVTLTARLNSAQPIAGIMYELDAIAATVIGGTSLMGGSGTLVGTLIGALIMGVLRNGLNLIGISSFLHQVVIGAVIIAAVLLDSILNARTSAVRARKTAADTQP